MKLTQSYDAIIVGSGATGGWAAKELTQSGLRVLVLEAGRELTSRDATAEAWARGQGPSHDVSAFARQPVQRKHPAFRAGNAHFFVDDNEHPYSHPEHAPFVWIRGRQVGGRSMMWGGQTWRLSDVELKAASRDGIGNDWPIGYADLRPHYDKVEQMIGIRGNEDGLPALPDCRACAPSKLTLGEHRLKQAVESEWPDRNVVAVRCVKLDAEAELFRGERCWPRFSAPGSTLAAADRTGLMTLRSDAVVSHLLMTSDETSARGVCFVDARERSIHKVFAKAVVLCASTLESTRILLNTPSVRPSGIGNRSGALGRYLMDHIGIGVHGVVPDLVTQADPEEERYALAGARGIYIPRFRNLGQSAGTLGFSRGYGIWGTVQREFRAQPSPGAARFFLFALGEMLPDAKNHVELSKQTDAWGVPTLSIHCEHGENELRMAEDARDQAKRMARCAGFVPIGDIPLFAPGGLVHEVGTARMGTDRNDSYLNAHCQSWEIPNLFVTDGACWTSSAYQNPTLTMMALTSYASRYVRDEVARR